MAASTYRLGVVTGGVYRAQNSSSHERGGGRRRVGALRAHLSLRSKIHQNNFMRKFLCGEVSRL